MSPYIVLFGRGPEILTSIISNVLMVLDTEYKALIPLFTPWLLEPTMGIISAAKTRKPQYIGILYQQV